MPLEPTPKQQRALEYFEQEIRKNGRAPSLRQAAADLKISHTAVAQFIQALESKGLLRRSGRYGRIIELRPENKAFKTVKYGFGEVMIQGKVVGVQRGPEQFG